MTTPQTKNFTKSLLMVGIVISFLGCALTIFYSWNEQKKNLSLVESYKAQARSAQEKCLSNPTVVPQSESLISQFICFDADSERDLSLGGDGASEGYRNVSTVLCLAKLRFPMDSGVEGMEHKLLLGPAAEPIIDGPYMVERPPSLKAAQSIVKLYKISANTIEKFITMHNKRDLGTEEDVPEYPVQIALTVSAFGKEHKVVSTEQRIIDVKLRFTD